MSPASAGGNAQSGMSGKMPGKSQAAQKQLAWNTYVLPDIEDRHFDDSDHEEQEQVAKELHKSYDKNKVY
jgi:hypothetical protein